MMELEVGKLITGVGERSDTAWMNRRKKGRKRKFLISHKYSSPALQEAN